MTNISAQISKFREKLMGRKICLVAGNHSAENKEFAEKAKPTERGIVSLQSSFRRQGIDFVCAQTSDQDLIQVVQDCDFIYIYAHGAFGEDGRLQGLLDYAALPYQGSGVGSSSICANKIAFKWAAMALGVPTPHFCCSDPSATVSENAATITAKIGYPAMYKDPLGGSSVGITYLSDADDLRRCLEMEDGIDQFSRGFVEHFAPGTFVTVAIFSLGGEIQNFPTLSSHFDAVYYDKETKLNLNGEGARFAVPADVSSSIQNEIITHSKRLYAHIGCKGMVRFDFLVDGDSCTILEANSIPGIAENSNLTSMAYAGGLNYDDLVVLSMAAGNETWLQ